MQNINNQFESEEKTVRESLLKMGFHAVIVEDMLSVIKSKDPALRFKRNETLRETANLLKGTRSGLRPWLVYDLLSKISGLTVNYMQRICQNINPVNMLKNGTKN